MSANVPGVRAPLQPQDVKDFQIKQLRRRYKDAKETTNDRKIVFEFALVPSDPDFPFEMDALQCVLGIPSDYPRPGRPTLRVNNVEMKRGFQINIEQGFDEIVARHVNKTLLNLVNELDKRLADFLSRPMSETVKLQRNGASIQPQKASISQQMPAREIQIAAIDLYTSEQKTSASAKRQADIRQLIARMGKLPHFKQSPDGQTFTLPFDPPKKSEIPVSLCNYNTIRLCVPELYNLLPCTVEFPGDKDAAVERVERAFERHCEAESQGTLLAHVNYLNQHLKTMASSLPLRPAPSSKTVAVESTTPALVDPPSTLAQSTAGESDQSHIQVIPRPPEWTVPDQQDDSGSEDTLDSDSEDGHKFEDENSQQQATSATTDLSDRGLIFTLPGLELFGIELLELDVLNLTVKCERCKTHEDISKLKNNMPKSLDCSKCGSHMTAGFRMDLLHAHAVRAGFLDLTACTVVDMLPSAFIPTCSECSTRHTSSQCLSVRGDSTTTFCRECHKKMTFSIPEVKFLLASVASLKSSRTTGPRKPKESLGIVAGQELARRGKCKHYSKSYRWFRFSCCSKVFPCDRCHDEQSTHVNEHANRMLCGFCSREQNFRPDDCGVCHAALTGKKGSGFWEGGKGTRDPARMSRKDPRKYKRRHGTLPRGA